MRSLTRAFRAGAFLLLACGAAPDDEPQELKLSACPAAVRKTLLSETRGGKLEHVLKEKDADGETLYWAEAVVAGRAYEVGVLENGTLAEMNLVVDQPEVPLAACPQPVQAAFQREAFGEKIVEVGKDLRYGVAIFETLVVHKGKPYQVVVAEDGTLVEKVLVIEDEEVELSACPAAVRAAFHEHGKGGKIGVVTRSTGLGRPTYEAEIELEGKVYLVELGHGGGLISKSLEAREE